VLGFGASAYPHWYFQVFGVWPVRISYVVVFAWLYEAFQYWQQTGWEKIQSAVAQDFALVTNKQPDGHLMGLMAGLIGGVITRSVFKTSLPSYITNRK
jgi:hypothetical protein